MMSTVSETNQLDVGGWSPDTLHAWVRSMLDQIDRRNEQRFIEQESALEKALTASNEVVLANFTERDKACELSRENSDKALGLALTGLRDYVDSRYENLANLIVASKTLKLSLIEGVKTQITSVHREIDIETKANKEAVDKADKANEKRFECVASDTPILCADLTWRAAGDLRVGDEIIGFDETAPTQRGRRFRRATVTANSIARDALFGITMENGASVRCNRNHPWLVKQYKDATWKWIETAQIRAGDIVMKPVDVWAVERSWESGWLAGLYDGEGCLSLDKNGSCQLSVTQRESQTSERIERVLSEFLGSEVPSFRMEAGKWGSTQALYHFIVSARPDVMRILGTIRPPRLLARSEGVWEGKPLGSWHRAVTVSKIESVGEGDIAQLSTSTATYIAAGFAMHNSVNEFRAQMADQSALFISRREVEAMVNSNADKVASLTDRINRSEGRGTGKGELWGYIMGGVAALLAIMMYLNSNKTAVPVGKIDLNESRIEALRDDIKQLRDAVTKPRGTP